MFKQYDQQDSHEFLTILLDWLHDDLNQVNTKSRIIIFIFYANYIQPNLCILNLYFSARG